MSSLDARPLVRTLIVGLGSFHGDDQAGWKVIDQLQHVPLRGVELRKAMIPLDILDWIDSHCSLHVIDACFRDGSNDNRIDGNLLRFDMVECVDEAAPSLRFRNSNGLKATAISVDRPDKLRSAGSHQIDALEVFELSARLGSLPQQLILWCIPGSHFAPGDQVSSGCDAAISSCVEQLLLELQ